MVDLMVGPAATVVVAANRKATAEVADVSTDQDLISLIKNLSLLVVVVVVVVFSVVVVVVVAALIVVVVTFVVDKPFEVGLGDVVAFVVGLATAAPTHGLSLTLKARGR